MDSHFALPETQRLPEFFIGSKYIAAGMLSRMTRNPRRSPATSYWLTRFFIVRLLGLVYFVAFLSLAHQAVPLIGHDGLLPADDYLPRLVEHFGSRSEAFLQRPTLFLYGISDGLLVGLAYVGAALALLVLLGYANAILLAVIWALYLSFVNIGQICYGYGWEIQLIETGFLAIFLCPLLDGRPFPRRPPPTAVIWLFRWLAFRIMLGSGLIKIRGDACWRELTCLDYHYETQPIPNPLSRMLHFMPGWFQKLGVLYNHLAELVAPWFVFGPRLARHIAGAILVSFQAILILSGNLSFLNWLTIVPALACFDDTLLRRIVPRRLALRAERAAAEGVSSRWQLATVLGLVLVVGLLSYFPVRNLLSSGQAMNRSFLRLPVVNTYGAFGSVGQRRPEIVIEGTADASIGLATVWKPYEFKCKPGDPSRRPCLVSPYHYRIDWQIWFAAMSDPNHHGWAVHLVWKLLHGDPGALSLLDNDPFPEVPPRYVRAVLYEYEFAPAGNPEGRWWSRKRLGLWLPPVSADDPRLRSFIAAQGWIDQP